ncbi:MAG: stress response translation initiation inhibitor YciH [Deltaproteobacteria bacterium]|nr:stress response translation initiation inhibitor YciH [Deltaproteobacteria bacterium]
MKSNSNNTLVYSTETGRVKPANSGSKPSLQQTDGIVRLQRQTKGRGGGTVIIISGIPLQTSSLKELAGELKKKCGCGGTVKEGVIEIQGDHRDALMLDLQARGYKVKLAGG